MRRIGEMTDPIDPQVALAISSILSQEGTADDHVIVQKWIAEDPENAKRVELVYKMRAQGRQVEYEGDIVAFLDRLHDRIGLSSTVDAAKYAEGKQVAVAKPEAKGLYRRPGLSQWIPYPVVGVIAGAILLVLGWQSGFRSASNSLADQVSTYATANGQRATISLPDGSTVQLNVGSKIEIPADYAIGNRNIKLNGEAIFDVKHRSSHPLIVEAGTSRTRVLGTKFLVRHYETDTATLVAVKDGKVAVGDLVLSAEEQVTVFASSTSPVHSLNNSLFTFTSGSLMLDEMPLVDAAQTLSRWYDVTIRIGDEAIARQNIKGTFTSGSISDLTEILELAFDVRVVREGRTLTLYQR